MRSVDIIDSGNSKQYQHQRGPEPTFSTCLRESPPQETTISRGPEQATPFLRITMITAKITLSTRNKQTTVQSALPPGRPAAGQYPRTRNTTSIQTTIMPVCLPLFGILVHVRLTSKERNRIRNCRKYHQYTDNDYAGLPPSVRHPRTRQINLKGKKQDQQLLTSKERNRIINCRKYHQYTDNDYAGLPPSVRHPRTRNPVSVQTTVWPIGMPLFGILAHVRLTSKERNRIRNCRKYHQYTDNDYAGLPPSVRHPRTRQINLKGKKQDPQLQEIPPVYKQRLCRSASLCSASSYTSD
ncbi:hypothetical protein J6590_069976 [Homalodisca vitripennis]|nr:hypothetical protein J6590_069976 [Homalodisca vitripennis]